MKVRGKAKIASIQRKNGEADLTLNMAVDIAQEMEFTDKENAQISGINKCTNLSFSSALDVVNIIIA